MSWEPSNLNDDFYEQHDDSSAMLEEIVSLPPGIAKKEPEQTSNLEAETQKVIDEPARSAKSLFAEKLVGKKDTLPLTERFPVLEPRFDKKVKADEAEISNMLRMDGVREYSEYHFDNKRSISNPPVQEKVIFNKSTVPILMANDYFKFSRTAEVKINKDVIDERILDTSLPIEERYPTIFPKEEEAEEVVFETFKIRSLNIASVDSGLNLATSCYNSASEGTASSTYSSSGYYASSTASSSPEKPPKNKKKGKKAFKKLDISEFAFEAPAAYTALPPGQLKCSGREPMYGRFK